MTFVPGTNRIAVAVGGLDAALGAAVSGDVLVLAPGTHTTTEPIGTGVTVRGQPGQRANTILQAALIGMAEWSTVRDLTVETEDEGAFRDTGVGTGMRWLEGIYARVGSSSGALIFEAGGSWTVRNCVLDAVNVVGTSATYMEVSSCLCINQAAAFYDSSQVTTSRIYNNTAISTNPRIILSGATYTNKAYNNVLYATAGATAGISGAGGTDTIYGNYSNYNLGNSSYGTVVSDLRLDPVTYYPLQDSPVRIGNAGEAGDGRLDLNYLPFGSSRSAGAFQWHDDASALYRPRYVDPLAGFDLTYDLENLDIAPGRVNFTSHLELAAYVRAYVNDLIHPSFGVFYTDRLGNYRLVTPGGLFDLTITGQSATVFGAQTYTAEEDTD